MGSKYIRLQGEGRVVMKKPAIRIYPVRFPEGEYRRLKEVAKAEDRTTGAVIRRAVREYTKGKR